MSDSKRYDDLELRVSYLEREVNGEKTVSRHILAQTRANSDDLATLISRTGRTDVKVDKLESRTENLERKFDVFVKEFPSIVADVVRAVLAENKA
jgi:seryl-tRNA synthetase